MTRFVIDFLTDLGGLKQKEFWGLSPGGGMAEASVNY